MEPKLLSEQTNPVLTHSDQHFYDSMPTMSTDETTQNNLDTKSMMNARSNGNTNILRRDIVLKSTHLIFFKIRDYVDFSPMSEMHFRFKRFLFIFKNVEAFFDFSLASVILISQIVILANIFEESKQACGTKEPARNLWMGAILCSLYAASVATELFLQALPYEIIGTTPEKAQKLIEWINMKQQVDIENNNGMNAINNNNNDAANNWEYDGIDIDIITSPSLLLTYYDSSQININNIKNLSNKAYVYATTATSYLYLVVISSLLQLSNILLLLVIGLMLGNSLTFTDLITKFISIEIVIHIHEIIPQVLKIRDKSPHSFNKSGIDLELDLENKGILKYGRIVPAKDNKKEIYRTSAKYHKNIIFWCFFIFVYVIFLIVLYSCKNKYKLGL
jgi:hypothetical protein